MKSPRDPADAHSASLVSWGLVALQAVILVGIAAAPRAWGPAVPSLLVPGVVAMAVGAAGAVAAAAFLGSALTPLPEPNGAGLSARGVYGWARHPMYTSVMIGALGVALAKGAGVSLLLVGALVLFFEFKTRREERFLIATYAGYAAYAARTGKYLPWWSKRVEPEVRSDGRMA